MNRLFGVILAFVASITIAFNANAMGPEHTGSWYNPDQSGHGFSIEYGAVLDTPFVGVYWYVYDQDGSPVFLTGTGYPDATGVDITFYAHYGMRFGEFDPATHQERDGGVARFNFQSANSGTFEYFPSTWTIQNFGHSQHQMPITKLFAVTHPNDEPPTGEPVPLAGQWSGRMIYDRRSNGACHDADVLLNIVEFNDSRSPEIGWQVHSITVIRDTGGLATAGNHVINILHSGFSDGWMYVFGGYIDLNIQFNTQGSAQGYWNYRNGDCYGEWTFTKD